MGAWHTQDLRVLWTFRWSRFLESVQDFALENKLYWCDVKRTFKLNEKVMNLKLYLVDTYILLTTEILFEKILSYRSSTSLLINIDITIAWAHECFISFLVKVLLLSSTVMNKICGPWIHLFRRSINLYNFPLPLTCLFVRKNSRYSQGQ